MTNKNVPAKALSVNARPAPSVLGLAVCATFAAGSASAVPIAVDLFPDITLGNFTLNIAGGPAEYVFEHQVFSIIEEFFTDTQNTVNTGAHAVVGFTIPPNGIDTKPGTYASALAAGESIDATRDYVSGSSVILSGNTSIKSFGFGYGEFFNSGPAYAGLRFELPSGTHFGWVEVNGGDHNNLTLTRYGYECEPDTRIEAGAGVTGASCDGPGLVPEPGTLALLIAGAAGIAAMRRRQRSA